MVRRICFIHLKNRHDTEDVFQNVYMKYLLYEGTFESAEHEKAWFVRVTINACTDWLRALSRRKWLPLDALAEESAELDDSSKEVLEVVTVISEDSGVMEQINASDSLQALGALVYSSDTTSMNEAHRHDMSFGKYRAFLELSQYDADITVEDCHGMSIGEIQNRIKTCQEHNEEHHNEHSESHGHGHH
ncbi:MAG: sigma-70 family RNA polymerase sigma factor [Eubacterium sp.]|nr:sigma-70 family RNA polymerase sigma factor [Eubacterium sp.]